MSLNVCYIQWLPIGLPFPIAFLCEGPKYKPTLYELSQCYPLKVKVTWSQMHFVSVHANGCTKLKRIERTVLLDGIDTTGNINTIIWTSPSLIYTGISGRHIYPYIFILHSGDADWFIHKCPNDKHGIDSSWFSHDYRDKLHMFRK